MKAQPARHLDLRQRRAGRHPDRRRLIDEYRSAHRIVQPWKCGRRPRPLQGSRPKLKLKLLRVEMTRDRRSGRRVRVAASPALPKIKMSLPAGLQFQDFFGGMILDQARIVPARVFSVLRKKRSWRWRSSSRPRPGRRWSPARWAIARHHFVGDAAEQQQIRRVQLVMAKVLNPRRRCASRFPAWAFEETVQRHHN